MSTLSTNQSRTLATLRDPLLSKESRPIFTR
jgi:hypothetical protein